MTIPFHEFVSTLSRPLAELPDPLPITPVPPGRTIAARLRPPGSKSLTNRAVLLGALAEGESVLRAPLLDAEDAEVMRAALATLGARTAMVDADLRITGVGGRWRVGPKGATLALANAGTAMRFLAAAAALADGPVTLDGSARMRERPIGGLGDALRALGVGVDWLGRPGFPPLRITPPAGGLQGGEVRVPTLESGQFLSALLLIAPWTVRGVRITIDGEPTSPPYLSMTARLLDRLGARDVRTSEDLRGLRVGPGPLRAFDLAIEPDASGAVPFWTLGAILPGANIAIDGLQRDSLQGDVRAVDALALLGATVTDTADAIDVRAARALRGAALDLADIPDAALALAVGAACAESPSSLTGLRTLRVKESDRLAALEDGLTRLGASVRTTADTLSIDRPIDLAGPAVTLPTHDDHRLAMAFALAGLRRPGVAIENPGCVAKTYPGFWADLGRVLASGPP